MSSPFEVLGLPLDGDVTDDDVRSAWRRIAAATHPDRADGGDPAAFAAAAAAYALLRTPAGRGEALASLREPGAGRVPDGPVPRRRQALARLATGARRRAGGGRPFRLAARLLVAAAVATLAVTAIGWQPASPAIIAGAVTWLITTGRRDLAPRQRVG